MLFGVGASLAGSRSLVHTALPKSRDSQFHNKFKIGGAQSVKADNAVEDEERHERDGSGKTEIRRMIWFWL
jgi:hypothetical protein